MSGAQRLTGRYVAHHRVYTVSPDALARVAEASAAYLDRLMNPRSDDAPAVLTGDLDDLLAPPPVAPAAKPAARTVAQKPAVTAPPPVVDPPERTIEELMQGYLAWQAAQAENDAGGPKATAAA